MFNDMEHLLIHPVFAALIGWLAFNFIMFRIEKDKADDLDKCFDLKLYVSKTWDNWIASLFCIPVVLFIGMKQLNIGMINTDSLQWNDIYYLFAGFVPELVIVLIKKWKQKVTA